MKTTKSARLFKRALGILPGGVDSPVRAFKSVGASPLFISRAYGARLEDVDGNVFIDDVTLNPGDIVKAVVVEAEGVDLWAETAR